MGEALITRRGGSGGGNTTFVSDTFCGTSTPLDTPVPLHNDRYTTLGRASSSIPSDVVRNAAAIITVKESSSFTADWFTAVLTEPDVEVVIGPAIVKMSFSGREVKVEAKASSESLSVVCYGHIVGHIER